MKKCQGNLTHYSVTSPEITTYDYIDEYLAVPETGCRWTEVLAQNARQAKVLALKTEEFKDWVDEARSDGINPFKGMKAESFICHHGTCFGCEEECQKCLDELEGMVKL